MSVRLIALLVLLAAVAASDFYCYEKGKASVIKDVIAGVATQQKKQEEVAKQDVVQATADTQTITQLEAERDALRRKNQSLSKAAKDAATASSKAPPAFGCIIEPAVLDSLRQAIDSTK